MRLLNRNKLLMVVLGLLLVVFGSVFALQGYGVLGGSSLMDNNPSWIYIGGFVALIGVALLALGARPEAKTVPSAISN